jgi:hypothetical protein
MGVLWGVKGGSLIGGGRGGEEGSSRGWRWGPG